jgi:hypothetical protein
MKRPLRGIIPLLFICATAAAQEQPYLIPQIVYVGDRATLVFPLTRALTKDGAITLDPRQFPASPDIELHRVTLERRPTGGRLLVEFSAYAPGLLVLPSLEIGGERFTGLTVGISSIIGNGDAGAVLSGPASPLAIPGTSLLIYGGIAAFVLSLLFLFWAPFWGRRHLEGLIAAWKRKLLIVSMRSFEKRLRKSLVKDGNQCETLNILSREFRAFLSFVSGKNCRAMTAAELGRLPPLAADLAAAQSADAAVLNGEFLGAFFRHCDELRFSGKAIAGGEALAALDDLRRFLAALDRAHRPGVAA